MINLCLFKYQVLWNYYADAPASSNYFNFSPYKASLLMHINQLLFTELLVFEMSHIMLPKSELFCTAYIVLYKKLKVIACQLPKDNTAYFDILKWLIWTFSTLEFLEITPLSVSYKFAPTICPIFSGFCSLVSSSKGSTMV